MQRGGIASRRRSKHSRSGPPGAAGGAVLELPGVDGDPEAGAVAPGIGNPTPQQLLPIPCRCTTVEKAVAAGPLPTTSSANGGIGCTVLLERLHRDHINLARLLDLLERELNEFYAGRESDFDLKVEMLEYIECYAELIHHPTEDRIFEAAPRAFGR